MRCEGHVPYMIEMDMQTTLLLCGWPIQSVAQMYDAQQVRVKLPHMTDFLKITYT